MKKLLSVLLSIVMAVTSMLALPVLTQAEEVASSPSTVTVKTFQDLKSAFLNQLYKNKTIQLGADIEITTDDSIDVVKNGPNVLSLNGRQLNITSTSSSDESLFNVNSKNDFYIIGAGGRINYINKYVNEEADYETAGVAEFPETPSTIRVESGSNLIVLDARIRYNYSQSGGGYAGCAIRTIGNSECTVIKSTIENYATYGYAIYAKGESSLLNKVGITISGASTVSGNQYCIGSASFDCIKPALYNCTLKITGETEAPTINVKNAYISDVIGERGLVTSYELCGEQLPEGDFSSIAVTEASIQNVTITTAVDGACCAKSDTKDILYYGGGHISICPSCFGSYKKTAHDKEAYGNVIVEATCSKEGSTYTNCSVCGKPGTGVATLPINPDNHTNVETIAGCPAICNDTGLTDGKMCLDCGEILIPCEIIPALDHSWNEGTITKAATCTEQGEIEYVCTMCEETKTQVIAPKHSYETTSASLTKNGSVKCKKCGYVKSVIYSPKTIKLSKTSYAYDGKAKTPAVTVTDSNGKKIPASAYTVKYLSNKNVGKASVRITFKGNYSGTKVVYFTINPKATTISKLTAASKGFTIKWKKQATQTSGYEIQYSTDKNFKKGNKTVTVSKTSTTSRKVNKLKGKKKYYVRIRTYRKIGSKKYYSTWSKSKTVTTKK